MTLILTVITKDFIVQAADRRITWLPDFRVDTDDRVKSVLCGNAIFAFTGLAEMPRSSEYIRKKNEKPEQIDSARWLSEVLSISDLDTAMELVANEASKVFQKLAKKYPEKYLTHFFVGSFWSKREGRRDLVPNVVLIHNLANKVNFQVRGFYLDESHDYFYLFSKPVTRLIDVRLKRQLSKIYKSGVSANAIARLMVETIRAAAKMQGIKRDIGYGINVTCIPRQVIEGYDTGAPIIINDGPIVDDAIRFRFFPPEEDSFMGFATSPMFVSGDLIAKSITLGNGGSLRIVPPGFDDHQRA